MTQHNFETSKSFVPTPDDTRPLRDAFSRFATGVTVVTVDSTDGPIGMTANSFSSVSLDPALVLWSPSIKSSRYDHFARAKHFAIHILADDQGDACNGFAKSANAFDLVDYRRNEHNVPVIQNCLARFECETTAIHPAGDHAIVIGQILSAEMRDGDALTFFAGKLGSFAAS